MKMRYLKVEVTLLKDIGTIDDQRIKVIDELILSDYPNKIILDKMGAVYSKSNSDAILITNQQIGYQSQRPEQDSAAEDNYIVKVLTKIIDRIAISQQGRYIISAELITNVKVDSHEDSLARFMVSEKDKESFIKAAGLKYFIEDESIVGTYSFEPFIKDNKFYFAAFNFQPKNEIESFREAITIFRDYKFKFEKLTDRMLGTK